MFSSEDLQQRIADALKRSGVDLLAVATSPAALDGATAVVCRLLPFGFRNLGKERVRGIILQIAERIPKSEGRIVQSNTSQSVGHNVADRLLALQDQIRESFGNSFGTKKRLRGYDAELDVLCGRLVRECESFESTPNLDKTTLIRILVSKAQILGNWQKLQGSNPERTSAALTGRTTECSQRPVSPSSRTT